MSDDKHHLPHAVSNNESLPSTQKQSIVANRPTVVIIIGMAGAGKTTLLHRINLSMLEQEKRGYYINLDPAARHVPFAANIDIRDTVDYKEVMRQYGLGPNGAILTSLNLFATRFDQVITLLEKRSVARDAKSDHSENEEDNESIDGLDYIFVDTPGQIEAFTWSAGGQIIHELFASSFPTVIMYVTDTLRCESPTTFMSNMLYATSVLFKSQLPLVCVFNKKDASADGGITVEQWMRDFETFQEALDSDRNGGTNEGYMTSLNRSLSLAMDEFYRQIKSVVVSAATGEGVIGTSSELFQCIDAATVEYSEVYLPNLMRRLDMKIKATKLQQEEDMAKLKQDIRSSGAMGDKVVVDARSDEI